jgi:hypothetical protein
MTPLRFLLTLFLTVALDLSSPVPFMHGSADAAEEMEDASHARSSHRRFRLVRDVVVPAVAREARQAELRRPAPLPTAPARPTAIVTFRKRPPSIAEPASAPEAH